MARKVVRCKTKEEAVELAAQGLVVLRWEEQGKSEWRAPGYKETADYVTQLCGMPSWPPEDFGCLVDEDDDG